MSYRLHVPVRNKWLKGVVSHVSDPEQFYCHLCDDKRDDELVKQMQLIRTYVHTDSKRLYSATIGQPVIAKYPEDHLWRRGHVTGECWSVLLCILF